MRPAPTVLATVLSQCFLVAVATPVLFSFFRIVYSTQFSSIRVLLCVLFNTIQTLSRQMRQSFLAILLLCFISIVLADVEPTFK